MINRATVRMKVRMGGAGPEAASHREANPALTGYGSAAGLALESDWPRESGACFVAQLEGRAPGRFTAALAGNHARLCGLHRCRDQRLLVAGGARNGRGGRRLRNRAGIHWSLLGPYCATHWRLRRANSSRCSVPAQQR